MVPKLHKKGMSFRGAAAYLLHDKDADTTHRVAWTETRNLATDDAHVAWRVMAATAMDQGRLKELAGIKNTGRKSRDVVLHMTLSWHPDEAEGLTREEMMRAANGALGALNAEDRQVLIVHHDDEPQPHIHLLINRVSPDDGRMLSSSKEKLNLSRWAECYERQRGEIYCEQRVMNNAARNRGEYTRGDKDRPRHMFELEAANQNHPGHAQIKKQQRRKDAGVALRERKTAERHTKEWKELIQNQRQQRASIRAQSLLDIENAKKSVREQFKPTWRGLFHKHQAGMREFEQRERKFLGRIKNAVASIDFGAILLAGERRKAISEAFGAFSSAGARVEAQERRQEAENRALAAQQRAAENEAAAKARAERDKSLADQRRRFLAERESLILKQRMEKAAQRAAWKSRREQRNAAYAQVRAHGNGAQQIPTGKQTITPSPQMETSINTFKEKMRQRNAERKRNRDRDDRGR